VVDDVLPTRRARGVEARGRAEVFEEGGNQVNPGFDAGLIPLHAIRIVSWGIYTDAYPPNSRSVS
jgi:hypothetical protein